MSALDRRHFIQTLAAGAAAAALPAGAPAQTPAAASGQNYAPQGGKLPPVVQPGEFVFAAAHLDHGHITGMSEALSDAGAQFKWVYDPDAKKVEPFLKKYPGIRVARSLDEILADPAVHLVASAAVTSERGPLGCRVMEAGKDYFTDKAPFTTLDQLAQARDVVTKTKRKYMVYFS